MNKQKTTNKNQSSKQKEIVKRQQKKQKKSLNPIQERQELEKQFAQLMKAPIGIGCHIISIEQQKELKKAVKLKKRIQKAVERESHYLETLKTQQKNEEQLKQNEESLVKENLKRFIKKKHNILFNVRYLEKKAAQIGIESLFSDSVQLEKFLVQFIFDLAAKECTQQGVSIETKKLKGWIKEFVKEFKYVQRLIKKETRQNDKKNRASSTYEWWNYELPTNPTQKVLKQERSPLSNLDISDYKMNYLNYLTSNSVTESSSMLSIPSDESSMTIQPSMAESLFLNEKSLVHRVSPNEYEEEVDKQWGLKQETSSKVERTIRKGHDTYCSRLEETMEACPFTRISNLSLLVHSHIKPWRDATDEERLDGYNGLLLEYGYDMLFDRGWISFENDGTLLISSQIPKELLHLYFLLQPGKVYDICNHRGKRSKYLDYHRQHIFKK